MPVSNDEILKEIHKIGVRQQRMERVLIGDKEYNVDGVCDKVDYLAKYIERDKLEKAKRTGMIIGGSVAGAGGTVGLIEWIKMLF
jgi:hypothetical protein